MPHQERRRRDGARWQSQKGYEVERRVNAAVTVEAGNGPGRWVELESQDALARLDARLNPDHGSAGPLVSDTERAERLAEVNAFFEGHDGVLS